MILIAYPPTGAVWRLYPEPTRVRLVIEGDSTPGYDIPRRLAADVIKVIRRYRRQGSGHIVERHPGAAKEGSA